MTEDSKSTRTGITYGIAAYTAWGILPLFWKFLSSVDSLQILACRIIFSLIFVWLLLAFKRRPRWFTVLRVRTNIQAALVSAILISINWGTYIWAVNSGHTVEAALGYYINPLVSIFLGLIFLKEKLTVLQWIAFALAFIGVSMLTAFSGSIPWISLILAFSFGFYGLNKKKLSMDSLDSLGAETLILSPLFASFLIFMHIQGRSILSATPPVISGLVLSGVITALPLLWFAIGTRRLPLSSMGFLQFIAPTLQLFIGVFVFKEAFPLKNLLAFVFVWSALILYGLSFRKKREQQPVLNR